jgi:DMSO/TMAO reductase YedYZ heme-binding membrane subunit
MIFNKIEAKKGVVGGRDTVVAIPFFKDLIIILGFSAIAINFLMCLVYLVAILAKKSALLPKWLAIINFIFLIVEFYFFFL